MFQWVDTDNKWGQQIRWWLLWQSHMHIHREQKKGSCEWVERVAKQIEWPQEGAFIGLEEMREWAFLSRCLKEETPNERASHARANVVRRIPAARRVECARRRTEEDECRDSLGRGQAGLDRLGPWRTLWTFFGLYSKWNGGVLKGCEQRSELSGSLCKTSVLAASWD